MTQRERNRRRRQRAKAKVLCAIDWEVHRPFGNHDILMELARGPQIVLVRDNAEKELSDG